MEIIKRGTKPQDKIYTLDCSNCNSKIKYFQYEGKITYDQRDGNFITFICPICDKSINVNL